MPPPIWTTRSRNSDAVPICCVAAPYAFLQGDGGCGYFSSVFHWAERPLTSSSHDESDRQNVIHQMRNGMQFFVAPASRRHFRCAPRSGKLPARRRRHNSPSHFGYAAPKFRPPKYRTYRYDSEIRTQRPKVSCYIALRYTVPGGSALGNRRRLL